MNVGGWKGSQTDKSLWECTKDNILWLLVMTAPKTAPLSETEFTGCTQVDFWERKMLENWPEDTLGSLVETVETVETVEAGETDDHHIITLAWIRKDPTFAIFLKRRGLNDIKLCLSFLSWDDQPAGQFVCLSYSFILSRLKQKLLPVFGKDFPSSSGSHSEIHVRQWSQNCENSKRDTLIVTDNGLWVSLLMFCPRLKISWIHLLQENKTISILKNYLRCSYVLLLSSNYICCGFQDNNHEPDTVPPSTMHPRTYTSNIISFIYTQSKNQCKRRKGAKEVFSVSAKYGNF